jgi:HK97 family phage portal protein
MNFSLQLGKFSLSFGQQEKTAFTQLWAAGRDQEEKGGAQLNSAFQQSTWVYSCATTLAENVSALRFRLLHGVESDESEIESGPLVDLFNQPSPYTNKFQFWELIVLWLCLRGEAFIIGTNKAGKVLPIRNANRAQIAKLCILNPTQMREDVRENVLMGWDYKANSRDPEPSVFLMPVEVIHFKMSNPYDAWRGASPLTVARLAAQSDYAAAQFMKGLMINNADTGVIVTTEQQLSEEQRLAVQKALEERKRKAGTADRPLFLFGGAKVEKPQLSSADMQFLENRKFARQEICAIYKVPQEMLGFTEDANRSVADAARESFIQNRISPLCAQLEAGIDPAVKSMDAGARGEFHIKGHPVMIAAQQRRWDTAVKQFGVGVPLNIINGNLDLGLPKLKHGDRSFLPFSLQELGADGAPVPEPAAPEGAPEKMLALLDELKGSSVKREAGNGSTVQRFNASTLHQCGPQSAAYAASIAGSVRKKRVTLRNFFVEQQGRVLAKMDSALSLSGPPSSPALLPQEKGESTAAPGTKAIDDIFDLLAENQKILKKMTPLLKGDLVFGGAQVWSELGLDPNAFSVPPAKAVEFLAKRKNEIENINGTTFERLKGSLSEGLSNGDTMDELRDRVKEVYRNATEARAETIAVTETNIAVQSGAFEGMKEAGVERKGWQASNLEGVRPEHLQAEADYMDEGIPLDEPFIVGGEELMHPGDPSGSAGNVINCRCFMFAVLPDKSARPTKFLGYDAWLEKRGGAL